MTSIAARSMHAIGVALVLVAAACGGGSEPPEATPPSASSSAPGSATPGPSPVTGDSIIDLAVAQPMISIIGAGTGDLRSDIPGLATGDFNKDGLDDILIGARFADGPDDSRQDSGEAYVVFGTGDPPSQVDLASGQQDLTVIGARGGSTSAPGDNLGFSVAAGDVNGDGVDDIVLGAPFAAARASASAGPGAVYVIFGRPDIGGLLDLASGSADVAISGVNSSAYVGDSVWLGDVNGDGLLDVITGATFDRPPAAPGAASPQGGAVYVFHGRREWPDTLEARQGTYDIALFGAEDFDELGDTVASTDLNGDGFDDVIATAEAADGPGNERAVGAEVHVLFGGSRVSGDFYVARGDPDLSIYGAETNDTLGFALAVGDLNGDGTGDLAMTARLADGAGNSAESTGEAYVLLGREDLPREIDLAEGLDDVLALYSGSEGDLMGAVLIGRLTRDDRDDLLLGVSFGDGPDDSRQDAGQIHILDAESIQGFNELDALPARLVVYGGEGGGRLGSSLAIGYVNADGRPELIAVAADADGPDGREDAGVIYVLSTGP